ncbi:STE/STE20/YSK protein kinase [Paracoccidioides brasiliensis]|uniref:non-specific serine/threonine protein kinase n=1 Tax=Paracoccidioides brasiliensis TaxID=121759 RepID=A0A1D2JQ47_PARBR|nr:STE/STE20/YSK protein kinase [Paracoccidioides brasiliensis]
MACHNSRARRNAFYGDQPRCGRNREPHCDQLQAPEGNTYFVPDAVKASPPDATSAYQGPLRSSQQQLGEAFPRSTSYSSNTWEDAGVGEPEPFDSEQRRAEKRRAKTLDEVEERPFPRFPEQPTNFAPNLWRSGQRPLETSESLVEAFPPFDPAPGSSGFYYEDAPYFAQSSLDPATTSPFSYRPAESPAAEAFPPPDPAPSSSGFYYEDSPYYNQPSPGAAPTSYSSHSPGVANQTPRRPPPPSDPNPLSDYSTNPLRSNTFSPRSPVLYSHAAVLYQPPSDLPRPTDKPFYDPFNQPKDAYQNRPDTLNQPKPSLGFQSPPHPFGSKNHPLRARGNTFDVENQPFRARGNSFGTENQPPRNPYNNPPPPTRRPTLNPTRDRAKTLPSAHDFQTFDRRRNFNPLYFYPGNERRYINNDSQLGPSKPLPPPPPHHPPPPPPLPPTLGPVVQRFPEADVYEPKELSANILATWAGEPADYNDLLNYSVRYSKLPFQSAAPIKRKPRRSIRIVESLKRIFSPRRKSSVTEFAVLPKIQVDESCFSVHNRWIEGAIDHTNKISERGTNLRPTMASTYLDPSSAMVTITKQKAEAMRLAKEQGAAVKEMCRRAKSDMPPYAFEELIGKGAYGRVYKGRQIHSQKVVAIKVLEIDTVDYKSVRDMKDESIKDFIHETKVMMQVKEAGAKNINMLIEAFSIHSQLWLVCEYCPGGSVKTLMRAMGDKLEERFIIPIARELAEGLKAIHDAGIIHRDIKAANVLIHEEGRLEICDFGVAGVLQSKVDKRTTWIGTPHWMPPEMFPMRGGGEMHQYGSEIDVWAYGCTLFECATGNPPNATLRERMQIGRQLNRFTPRLEDDSFTEGLRSLVSFTLDSDPTVRPTMEKILQHHYLAHTRESHPTTSLRELVKIYYQWAQRGGQRISLFNPGGAIASEFPGEEDSIYQDDWNFSTTTSFERRFSLIDFDQLSASLAELEDEITPTPPEPPRDEYDDSNDADLTAQERANFDERVKRGAAAMEGIFNEDKPDYKYETKRDFVPVQQQRFSSDLPLRTDTDRSSVTSTLIDLNLGDYESSHYAAGSASNNPRFQLADANTIRANRSSSKLTRNSNTSSDSSDYQPARGPRPPTMEWTFPSSMSADAHYDFNHDDDSGSGQHHFQPQHQEKRDTCAWTFPIMTTEPEESSAHEEPDQWGSGVASSNRLSHEDDMAKRFPTLQWSSNNRSMGLDGASDSRPSTATSYHSATSDADNDPFRFDRPVTPPAVEDTDDLSSSCDTFPSITDSAIFTDFDADTAPSSLNYTAYSRNHSHNNHRDNCGMGNSNGSLAGPGPDHDTAVENGGVERSQCSAEPDAGHLDFPQPVPPSMESLTEGASDEVFARELTRLLGEFLNGLAITGQRLVRTEVGKSREVGADVNGNGIGIGSDHEGGRGRGLCRGDNGIGQPGPGRED